ncbi:hypothetical protein KPH14_000930 [Odynerus spinipes]|uniref:Uncharacterized protein n=1 Tax=Odynerus spinipes TaxID=1348599 RepID=A0AAD9RFJ3_9HYME|nr:hypothetical protein KPH14_000930 [Odynerus spinipes]
MYTSRSAVSRVVFGAYMPPGDLWQEFLDSSDAVSDEGFPSVRFAAYPRQGDREVAKDNDRQTKLRQQASGDAVQQLGEQMRSTQLQARQRCLLQRGDLGPGVEEGDRCLPGARRSEDKRRRRSRSRRRRRSR